MGQEQINIPYWLFSVDISRCMLVDRVRQPDDAVDGTNARYLLSPERLIFHQSAINIVQP